MLEGSLMKGKHAKATATKQTLTKRALALIFAAALLCGCLLSVFASGPSLVDTIKDATSTLDAASAADDADSASSGYMTDFAAYYDSIACKTTYRFWLQETNELAEVKDGTRALSDCADFYKEVVYRDGKTLEKPSDFVDTPTDPTGAGRTFEGWYFYDANGEKQTFEFNGFVLTIVEDSTVDVFAKWKELPKEEDASSDGDKNKDADQKSDDESKDADSKTDGQKTDDKTADSSSKSTDSKKSGTTGTKLEETVQDAEDAKVSYTVTVEELPETAKKLEVSTTYEVDEAFADTVKNSKLTVMMQFNITPQDAEGNTVQPEEGKPATVSIGGFSMKDGTSVKVLHLLKDGKVGTLNGTVSGGILTFETTSFSEFVVAMDSTVAATNSTIATPRDNVMVFLYIKVIGDKTGLDINVDTWYTIGRFWLDGLDWGSDAKNYLTEGQWYDSKSNLSAGVERWKLVTDALKTSNRVERWKYNQSVVLDNITWEGSTSNQKYGLKIDNGATDYGYGGEAAWHLDGYIDGSHLANYVVKYIDEDTGTEIKDQNKTNKEIGTVASYVYAKEYSDINQTIVYEGVTYQFDYSDKTSITLVKDSTKNVLNLYYKAVRSGFAIKKEVKGNMGDQTKDFNFTVTIKKSDNQLLNDYTIKKRNDSTTYKSTNGTVAFTLKHDEKVFLDNVPYNAIVTITETGATDYIVSASVGSSTQTITSDTGDSSSFTFIFNPTDTTTGNAIGANGVVTIINTLDASPPEGVLLDTLPYLLLLAAVGMGAVVLVMRRRRE